ncbi:hypothetical protein FRC01_004393 [Tulasnella sp. 417]|nr:hypothetical protein FRC01_004393 [Tulasnella sp. 417]
MSSNTLRIVSIVQARVDAFLKDIFDLCKSSDSSAIKSETLSSTIATEIAICDSLQVAIRRRRNERTLFGRLDTDIVHSIFEIALDLEQVHDSSDSLGKLSDHRRQLFRLRRVCSVWNSLVLSSPRYWQVINIKSPPQVITATLKRSGSAQLCLYCRPEPPQAPRIDAIPEELRSCARIRTILSTHSDAYRLFRWLLQGPMPVLRTLVLKGTSRAIEGQIGPIGDLPSIQTLITAFWRPPSGAAWLFGLKELMLHYSGAADMELLQLLSACPNLNRLLVSDRNEAVVGELSGSISPITLPRLKYMTLESSSHESVAKIIRVLAAPQCIQCIVDVGQALHLSRYVADYRRLMSLAGGCAPTQNRESASILIKRTMDTRLEYKMEDYRLGFTVFGEEEVPAFHDLVQGIQSSLQEPPITLTIHHPSKSTWMFLKSLGDQNIQEIVAYFPPPGPDTRTFLKAIGAGLANPPGGPPTDTATDRPFKSLAYIEIHDAYVNLVDFTRLAEEYLPKARNRC